MTTNLNLTLLMAFSESEQGKNTNIYVSYMCAWDLITHKNVWHYSQFILALCKSERNTEFFAVEILRNHTSPVNYAKKSRLRPREESCYYLQKINYM